MERTIPTANIFPPGDPAKEDPLANTDPEFDIDLENYATVRENEEDTTIEIDRVIKRKFVERVDKKTVAKKYTSPGRSSRSRRRPRGSNSKMSIIIKEKEDGSKKRRIIVQTLEHAYRSAWYVPGCPT